LNRDEPTAPAPSEMASKQEGRRHSCLTSTLTVAGHPLYHITLGNHFLNYFLSNLNKKKIKPKHVPELDYL
jgi:hypothetical protein